MLFLLKIKRVGKSGYAFLFFDTIFLCYHVHLYFNFFNFDFTVGACRSGDRQIADVISLSPGSVLWRDIDNCDVRITGAFLIKF